jgi:hypothetical protein
MNDPDDAGNRVDSCSDNESDSGKIVIPSAPVDKDMERVQNDTALRHHLGIGSSFTGPKGVKVFFKGLTCAKADYKFHMQQERARAEERRQEDFEKISRKAMTSGWMQRTIEEEENKEEVEAIKLYRQKVFFS